MDQSISGIGAPDPSGSTPQPAPLSGLPLAGFMSGSGDDSMSGIKSGGKSIGGMEGGPSLQELLAMLGGNQGGDTGSAPTPPNLSSLFGNLGTGSIAGAGGGVAGATGGLAGFGQAGGLSSPSFMGQAASGAGSPSGMPTGSTDPLSIIRQALGIGSQASQAADKFGQPGVAGQTSGVLDPTGGTSTQGATTASPYAQEGLQNAFLNDPSIEHLFTSGELTGGSPLSADMYAQLQQDPAFLEAMSQFSPNQQPFGPFNENFAGGAGGGFDLSSLGQSLGGLQSLFGLAQDAQSQNPMGILKDLYGLYSNANSLFSLGGPTASSLLSQIIPEGLSTGIEGLSAGLMETIGPLLGLAPEAVSGALSFGTGLAGAFVAPVISDLLGGSFDPTSKAQETGDIRKNFPAAFSTLQKADPYFKQLQGLGNLTPDQQTPYLQNLAQQGLYEAAQIPSVSHYTSTQGGRHTGGVNDGGLLDVPFKVKPLDVTGIEKQTPELYERSILNALGAEDLLSQRGIPQDISKYSGGPGSNALTLLGDLSGEAGLGKYGQNPLNVSFGSYQGGYETQGPGNLLYDQAMANYHPGFKQGPNEQGMMSGQYNLSPEQYSALSAPGGNMLATVQDIFSQLNPNFAQSQLGMDISSLGGLFGPGGFGTPAGGGGPVDFASMLPGGAGPLMNEGLDNYGFTSPAGSTSGG